MPWLFITLLSAVLRHWWFCLRQNVQTLTRHLSILVHRILNSTRPSFPVPSFCRSGQEINVSGDFYLPLLLQSTNDKTFWAWLFLIYLPPESTLSDYLWGRRIHPKGWPCCDKSRGWSRWSWCRILWHIFALRLDDDVIAWLRHTFFYFLCLTFCDYAVEDVFQLKGANLAVLRHRPSKHRINS